METKYWSVSGEAGREHPFIRDAARFLREGGLVAFPTETVYGLGADARSDRAVERIFQVKGRPPDNPLIVHIADLAQLEQLVSAFPERARRLCERFWPGPLTIVLPVKPGAVSRLVTAGLPTVAVRMPDHPIALALIREAGCPVAAPSANLSGRPSPSLAAHVLEDLHGRIEAILDGGACGVGLESTVVEWAGDRLHILRPGGVTPEQLRGVPGHRGEPLRLGASAQRQAGGDEPQAPRAPGMKYAHYAPRGELTVVKGESARAVAQYINRQADAAGRREETTGVLTFQADAALYPSADIVLSCGGGGGLNAAARELYRCLRAFDERGASRIWAEACPEEGVGYALMNRLRKAAGGRIVEI